jgi:hypothetical protein
MTSASDLAKLQGLAQMVLDHRLARMREAAAQEARSRAQLAALDQAADPGDLPPVAADLVVCTYRRWADARRVDINNLLARQTVQRIEARAAAELAFGRVQALNGIAARNGKGRPS